MVLDRKGGKPGTGESFERIVIKIDVGQGDIFIFQRINVNAEAVILAGYFNPARFEIFYRMVRTPVSEFELVRFASQCKCQKLVAQADSEYRHFAEQVLYRINRINNGRRVAGAVTQKYAVRFSRQDIIG